MIGVYSIRNRIDGKRYVGSSNRISRRWRQHQSALIQGRHPNPKLQSAVNKHGMDQFEFELLEECDISELLTREQTFIASYDAVDCGYNIARDTLAPALGRRWKLTEETRGKIRAARVGKMHTDETKKKVSASRRGIMTGPRPPEVREKISKALRGRKQHPNCSFSGKTHTDEARRKISEASRRAWDNHKMKEVV